MFSLVFASYIILEVIVREKISTFIDDPDYFHAPVV